MRNIEVSSNVDKTLGKIQKAILKAAGKTIPRGKMKRYIPFWSDKLQRLKLERDSARTTAERTKRSDDYFRLKEKTAIFKKEIIQSKRSSYQKFLSNLDFRKDAQKTDKFLSRLNNKNDSTNKPFKNGDKLLTDDSDIAKYFCKHVCKISNFRPKTKSSNHKAPVTCLTNVQDRLFNKLFSPLENWI